MKKVGLMLATLVLLASCAGFGNKTGTRNQITNDTGKVSYTKENKACRPFMFGNPSVAELAKEVGMKEVVTIENDNYFFFNCVTVKGN